MNQEDDVWQQVVDQLNLFTDVSAMMGSGSSVGLSGEVGIPGVAKMSPSFGQQGNSGTTTNTHASLTHQPVRLYVCAFGHEAWPEPEMELSLA